MAESETMETGTTEGQADLGTDGSQTTDTAPDVSDGQSVDATTDTGTQQETFYDPKDLPPELKEHYKNMQRSYSKGMETLKQGKQKIQAFDAFQANPVEQMKQFAQQNGYTLTQAQAQQAVKEAQGLEDPQTWDEVTNYMQAQVMSSVQEYLKPILGQVQSMRKDAIETQLSEIDPAWHQYEDEMMAQMGKHPTLQDDPALLYRMSVPSSVLESQATQRALAKQAKKANLAKVGGSSTTTKQPQSVSKPKSFQEAVERARARIAAGE